MDAPDGHSVDRYKGDPMSESEVRFRPVGRRQFLTGMGVSVGLPLLPSIATRKAFAQDPTFSKQKNFFFLGTWHGACFDSNMFPSQTMLNQSAVNAATGHTIRWGKLAGATSGANTVLSPALTAPSSVLTPGLVAKMNVLHGLDQPMHTGHMRGAMFGNYADSNGIAGLQIEDRPTIDQIMAWSKTYYANLDGVQMRSMAYGPSWGFGNPQTQTGGVQPVRLQLNSRDLFLKIFTPKSNTQPLPEPRKPIVDRVLESYRRLRNGDRRLSSNDRQRLDNHISMLSEVERRLNANNVQTRRGCPERTTPVERHDTFGEYGATPNFRKSVTLLTDVFAVAFACGSSRIATMVAGQENQATGYTGSWHQEVAHQYQRANAQPYITSYYKEVFNSVFLGLAKRLEELPGAPGRTLLDDSLLIWTQECGMDTHMQINIPVVTIGAGGGGIKTGQFVDYRDMRNINTVKLADEIPADIRYQHHGLTYNQFLASVLQGMGVARPEFELFGYRGYGEPGYGAGGSELPRGETMKYYGDRNSKFFQSASDPLPQFMV